MPGRAAPAVAAAAWTAVVVASTAQSSYALWSVNLLHPEDVAAAQWLVHQHPSAAVVPVISDWPGRTSVDYERYVQPFAGLEPGLDDVVRAQLSPAQRIYSPSIPLSPQLLAEVAQLHPQQPTFVVFTESMRQSDAYYATYTPGSFRRTLSSLGTDPDWTLAWHRGGAWIYRYHGPAAASG
jgi:hypothetical protein